MPARAAPTETGRIDRTGCGHRGVLLQERHWTVISKDHAVTAFASGKHARGGPLHHVNGRNHAAPALVSHPVPARRRNRCCAPFISGPTNSLNRVCLEDRPGATISFTGHDAQPQTGTTPAPVGITAQVQQHAGNCGGPASRDQASRVRGPRSPTVPDPMAGRRGKYPRSRFLRSPPRIRVRTTGARVASGSLNCSQHQKPPDKES